jgi:hypothetical protein
MPIISAFFGIIVRMYYDDHSPAHCHAEFQGDRGSFGLDGEPLSGEVRSRIARRLIREWAVAHRGELEQNWLNASEGRPMHAVAPLE